MSDSAQLPEEVKTWITKAPPDGLGKTIESVVEIQSKVVGDTATIYTVLFTDGQVHSYTEYTAQQASVASAAPVNIAEG
jgi:hypothetical protein